MRPRCLPILLFLLAPFLAHAQEWSRFEWVRATMGGERREKAAIYVPVRLEGVAGAYSMQLDTGSPRTLLYEVPYKQVLQQQGIPGPDAPTGQPPERFSALAFSGSIGALVLDEFPVLLYRGYGTPLTRGAKHPKIGTLGLDLLEKRPLILDFPRRRFAVLGEGASLPPDLESRARFFGVSVRDGRLFLPVLCDGRSIGSVFFDTGSSLFPLVTARSIWRELTGRTGDEPDNEHLTISAWGHQVVMTGAMMRQSLHIGPVNVGRKMVYFAPADYAPLSFEKHPSKASGLVGNASFYDDDMVIIDLPRERMAILPSR